MQDRDLSAEALDALLLTGEDEPELRAYFGDDLYEELRDLAHIAEESKARTTRAREQVFILPGIMGSKLSTRADGDTDLVWLNPLAIRRGRVTELAYPSDDPEVLATGIFHLAYQRMRLRLIIKGFDVTHLPFDWRLSVPEIADRLWPHIAGAAEPVSLICHSMGGLVGRALAARDQSKRIRHVVTLGTPNAGSYAPVTVLRGLHKNVQLLARIDPNMGPKELVDRIIKHYPGLLEMMPSPDRRPEEPYFGTEFWPDGSLLPPPETLLAAAQAQNDLPPPDDRFTQIIGMGKETITGARVEGGKMVFTRSGDGDGTVPRDLAEMDGASHRFYVEGGHGGLCNQRKLINACADVLRGRVPDLPIRHDRLRGTQDAGQDITEKALHAEARRGLPRSGDPEKSDFSDARLLQGFLSAEADIDPGERAALAPERAPPPPPMQQDPAETFVYTRQRQALRRINVDVMNADILDVPADAYVLGIFEGVTALGGAAGAVDTELNGMLSALIADGQVTGRKGEISFIPVPRHHLKTSHVVIVGLGTFGADAEITAAVHVAGRNLMRALCISGVSSLAGVLLGAGSGAPPLKIFKAFFAGIFEALADWDREQEFSRVKICELKAQRYGKIVDSLNLTFAGFNMPDCEVVVAQKPVPPMSAPRRAAPPRAPMPDIFSARATLSDDPRDPEVTLHLHHVAGSGSSRAAVPTSVKSFRLSRLDRLMAPLEGPLRTEDLAPIAAEIEALVLEKGFREALVFDHAGGQGLQVICDQWASRVPWEVLHLGGGPIALSGGLSRWFLPASAGVRRSARRPLMQGTGARTLNMLMVSDPTNDLPGARREAAEIQRIVDGLPGFALHPLKGNAATHEAVTQALARSDSDAAFDIFHYAGHAFFDAGDRARSGLLLNRKAPLRGTEVAGMAQVPGFVFLNACESVRVRDASAEAPPAQAFAAQNAGLSEAFLLAGVRHILGTFWPVPDKTAKDFAGVFYEEARARPIGVALREARRIVARDTADWVNYIHYGAGNDRI